VGGEDPISLSVRLARVVSLAESLQNQFIPCVLKFFLETFKGSCFSKPEIADEDKDKLDLGTVPQAPGVTSQSLKLITSLRGLGSSGSTRSIPS